MVGYDDNNNALTLGDDDALSVGDYDLEYDSTADEFQVNHPNGEVSSIPRSTSGSLVPQGLAESVSAGEALADDGNTYSSIQTAVDNATGLVFVGPGTFNETVNVGTNGLTIEGVGYGSHIDGGGGRAIDVGASNVTIRNLSISNTSSGVQDDGPTALWGAGAYLTVDTVVVRESDDIGILCGENNTVVKNCVIEQSDGEGIYPNVDTKSKFILVGNIIQGTAEGAGIKLNSDDCTVSGNIVKNAGSNGIESVVNDNVIGGNRVTNSGNYGIAVSGTDSIVYNNRVSDSTNANISDNGTGTVLDGNLTGASN